MIVLLFCLAIPCILLVVYSGIESRNEAVTLYQKATLRIVNNIASEQQAVVAGAEQLVTALALLPQVKSRDRKATDAILSELLKKNPDYANIAVADKAGLLWASAVPFEGNVSVADRKYFREAVLSGTFSSGEYTEGRITKKAVINFSYPVKNTAEGLESVIVVAQDLGYAQRIFEKISLPKGASFALLDHQGIILIQNLKDPLSKKLIGKRDLNEAFSGMRKEADEGTFESIGNDGQRHLIAYKRISLPHESQPYLYVRSSIPLASITSRASAAMFKNLIVIVLFSGAGLFLFWFIGRRMIVDPIMHLKKASKELEVGSSSVRVSQAVRGGELGDLAHAFDQMADTLIQRATALRESEAKANAMIRYAPTGICEIDYRGPKFISVNDAMCQILGYSREELISMGPGAILDEKSRVLLADRVRRQLAGEKIEESVEYRVRKKDDSFIDTILNISLNQVEGEPWRALVIVHDITERKRMEEELRSAHAGLEIKVLERTEELANSQQRLQQLASQLLLAQEKERKRVAVELHDGLLSELAATKYLLEGKMMLLKKGNIPDPGEFQRVVDILASAMREARRIMNNLHPSVLDELGLIATVNWVCMEYQKSYPHIMVQKDIGVSEEDISFPIKVVIYRVLQEALNNFARHGKGNSVDLSLTKSDGTFALTIRDNGQGFDVEKAQKGLGLESMRERVEISGGVFKIESASGVGTAIQASWPLAGDH